MTVPHVDAWDDADEYSPADRWRIIRRPVIDVEIPGVNDPLSTCPACRSTTVYIHTMKSDCLYAQMMRRWRKKILEAQD